MEILPSPLTEAILLPNFTALVLPITINQARSVVSLGTSDFLVLERGGNRVVLCTDTDGDGWADATRTVASASRLNHGMAVHDGYLYASSDEFVYRWSVGDGDDISSATSFDTMGEREIVIDNINRDGNGGAPSGHTTRTLAVDDTGRLYVSVGSDENVDPDSFRSRIRRFELSSSSTLFPLDFVQGEVFADGLRNEVGLAFDRHGVLWGVENGADNLARGDLGGDIHNDNPAEELNRFKEQDAGKHWGYPFCWTEFRLPNPPGLGVGTVWAWPSFLNDYSDQRCRTEFMTSEMAMQAHSAPLGIVFYKYTETRPTECTGSPFPRELDGYAFIANHGSWNRDIPVGYNVAYVEMSAQGEALGQPITFLSHEPPNARWPSGFRPVDVDFDACGRLLVTSDGTRSGGVFRGSMVVRIEYKGEDNQIPPKKVVPNDSIKDDVDKLFQNNDNDRGNLNRKLRIRGL